MQHSPRKRIVILGAGFGGLYAALELDRSVARDPNIEVVLVNPQNFLVFTPMLHEVAAGSLDPNSIVVPIRQVLKHVRLHQAEAIGVDFERRTVTTLYGVEHHRQELQFDQLLIAVGSQTRFPPGLRQYAHGMKSIHDALILRNWLIELLERAELESDPSVRRALLTIVVAGGGFSGVETIGAINDFLLDVSRHYPGISAEAPSLILAESNSRLLPEFDPALSAYTEAKLRASGIDIRLYSKVAAYDGRVLTLDSSAGAPRQTPIATRTLIWTAGLTPSPLIESLSLPKERGRIIVDASMAVPGFDGVWVCGDCAAIPDATGKFYPPTAQHAVRQGRRVGANIAAAVRGHRHKIRPFQYRTVGQSAAIGRHRAVATLTGIRFSGFLAWLFWRSAYLFMLPRLDRKIRVLLQWTLEVCFARDNVQLLTVQSLRSGRLEELMDGTRTATPTGASERADPVRIASSDQTATNR